MSANDCGTLDCIRNELDWIPKVVEARVPFLGLCLGAQLLTRTLGGKVRPHPEGRVEIGYTKVEPTTAGRRGSPIDARLRMAPRGHGDSRVLELLARSEHYPVQAFRFGESAFGFQFHPEVTYEMKEIWT